MSYCYNNFERLAKNEYASRVMQALVTESSDFRTFTLNTLIQSNDLIANHIPAVFLASSAIRHSHSNQEYLGFRDLYFANRYLLKSKHFKRVLVSVVE